MFYLFIANTSGCLAVVRLTDSKSENFACTNKKSDMTSSHWNYKELWFKESLETCSHVFVKCALHWRKIEQNGWFVLPARLRSIGGPFAEFITCLHAKCYTNAYGGDTRVLEYFIYLFIFLGPFWHWTINRFYLATIKIPRKHVPQISNRESQIEQIERLYQ